jgi:hypothetical protein
MIVRQNLQEGLDRVATCDEVRLAISLLTNYQVDLSCEMLSEIVSDGGLYVRFSEEEAAYLASSGISD